MEKKYLVGVSIVTGISIIGIAALCFLYSLNIPECLFELILTWLGIIGTCASIVLSILAMVYSNKSSSAAEKSLNQVNEHYTALCNALQKEYKRSGFGQEGIDAFLEQLERERRELQKSK